MNNKHVIENGKKKMNNKKTGAHQNKTYAGLIWGIAGGGIVIRNKTRPNKHNNALVQINGYESEFDGNRNNDKRHVE